MLRSADHQRVAYKAPISATQVMIPKQGGSNLGCMTPSGQEIGGAKVSGFGAEKDRRDALNRYRVGPPTRMSQGPWVQKSLGAQYLTEGDVARSHLAGADCTQESFVAIPACAPPTLLDRASQLLLGGGEGPPSPVATSGGSGLSIPWYVWAVGVWYLLF